MVKVRSQSQELCHAWPSHHHVPGLVTEKEFSAAVFIAICHADQVCQRVMGEEIVVPVRLLKWTKTANHMHLMKIVEALSNERLMGNLPATIFCLQVWSCSEHEAMCFSHKTNFTTPLLHAGALFPQAIRIGQRSFQQLSPTPPSWHTHPSSESQLVCTHLPRQIWWIFCKKENHWNEKRIKSAFFCRKKIIAFCPPTVQWKPR